MGSFRAWAWYCVSLPKTSSSILHNPRSFPLKKKNTVSNRAEIILHLYRFLQHDPKIKVTDHLESSIHSCSRPDIQECFQCIWFSCLSSVKGNCISGMFTFCFLSFLYSFYWRLAKHRCGKKMLAMCHMGHSNHHQPALLNAPSPLSKVNNWIILLIPLEGKKSPSLRIWRTISIEWGAIPLHYR